MVQNFVFHEFCELQHMIMYQDVITLYLQVDSLHEAKQEKAADLDALREMCEKLLDQKGVKDKYAVKETLADVESKWNDMTDLLVQNMSLEVRNFLL